MNGVWQTLIGGLAVAAISGLTFIAYRHPTSYQRIYVPLLCVLGGAWAIWFIYGLGFSSGFSTATIETIKLNPHTGVKTPSQAPPSLWLLYVVPALLYIYPSFLRHILPLVFGDEKSAPEHDEE